MTHLVPQLGPAFREGSEPCFYIFQRGGLCPKLQWDLPILIHERAKALDDALAILLHSFC